MTTSLLTPSRLFRLYLGRAIPEHRQESIGLETVHEQELLRFIETVVAPNVPGFTLIRARGGWSDETTGRLVQEPTAILEVFDIPGGDDRLAKTVHGIAQAYGDRYGQDAVILFIVDGVR